MSTKQLPPLYKLNFSQVLDLVRDIHCFQLKYRIILAVDCADIVDYCYPINPGNQRRDIDPDALAEGQTALNHLFRVDELERLPVLLLPEYREELQGLQDAISRQAGMVFSDAEMISQMIQVGDLDEITSEQEVELERMVQEHFQFLLTVLLGIHSLGSDRLDEVYKNRLTTQINDIIQPEDVGQFKRIWDGYTPSRLYETILKALETENTTEDRLTRAREERANKYDASAIDRLMYLNREAERAYLGGTLKHKYLFLYISTTSKSRRVFNLPAVKAALPIINGRRYSFWRDRHQIFAYVIHRSQHEDARQRTRETANELRRLSQVLRKVKRFERVYKSESNDCRECVLEGKTPASCPLVNYCQDVAAAASKIKAKKEEVNNWGLFQQIEQYRNLLDADVAGFGSGKILLSLFKDMLDSSPLRDIALERMRQRMKWIARTSEGTRLFDNINPTKELLLRSDKDPVASIDQYLPVKPRFESEAYKEIIALILGFYRESKRVELFDAAYHKFLGLDPDSNQGDDEYDLLKCYLFLASPFEEKIHSYLSAILLPKLERDATRRESLYILCWSARRAGLYQETDGYSRAGMAHYPNDPRFYHGHALNIHSWLEKDAAHCPYPITDAVSYSERALALYEQHPQENADVIAACYNNLAYFLALNVKTDNYDRAVRTQKLEEARAYLERLKGLSSKASWSRSPTHPEFLHTEAFLEHQEVIHYWTGQERDKEQLKKKLKSAKDDVELAIEIYDGPLYQELRNDIDDFYQKIVAGIIK